MSTGDTWQHLNGFGYAPGNYMNKCHRCERVVSGVDKRAITCRPCAEQLLIESQAAQIAALTAERDALQHIAAIAHNGGLVGLSEASALAHIRGLTLLVFNRTETPEQASAAVRKAIDAARTHAATHAVRQEPA